jgi:DNA-binding transcriptional regulator YiaG
VRHLGRARELDTSRFAATRPPRGSPAPATARSGSAPTRGRHRLGADTASVTNWELNRTKPALRFLPGIIRLLGYTPWTADGSVGERLLAYRRERGLSQAALALLLDIDPGTVSKWERGPRVPTGGYTRLAEAFLVRCARDRAAQTDLPPFSPLADV